MTREEILAAIDGEITRLQQVQTLLRDSTSDSFTPLNDSASGERKKRILSPDARSRIAQAQKRRWAKARNDKAGADEHPS